MSTAPGLFAAVLSLAACNIGGTAEEGDLALTGAVVLSGSADASSGVNLAWTTKLSGATQVSIRRGVSSQSMSELATLAVGQTSYVDTAVSAGTTYYYRVIVTAKNIRYGSQVVPVLATGGFVCGDGVCDDAETCTSCASDCGACGTGLTLSAGSGTIVAPFYLSAGALLQDATDYAIDAASGSATYTFTIATAGDYVIDAVVSAPSYSTDSFFINIDAQPQAPTMVWDVPLTQGFENHTVAWRGSGNDAGDPAADQFAPKVFSLAAGTHKLIVRGREGNTRVQQFTLVPKSVPDMGVGPQPDLSVGPKPDLAGGSSPDFGDPRVVTMDKGYPADVQKAIDGASEGDTVLIPSGVWAWSGGVTLKKGVIVSGGGGGGATTLTHNYGDQDLFTVTESAQKSIVIKNLSFVQGSAFQSNQREAKFINVISANGRPVIIHHNTFTENNSDAIIGILMQTNRGVIYGKTFTFTGGTSVDTEAIQFKAGGLGGSWSSNDTMGNKDATGTSNIYVEDNTFSRFFLKGLDFDDNSRVVVRHNTFSDSALVAHGADTSAAGARHFEIYGNTFTFTNRGDCSGLQTVNMNWSFYIRGGTGIIANNQLPSISSCAWGTKPNIEGIVQNLRRNAGQYACWKSYPAPHQFGQSYQNGATSTDPVFIWGNTGTGNPTPVLADYSPNECGASAPTSSSFIQAGRDYVMAAKPGYAAYTYPHPLRTTVPQ